MRRYQFYVGLLAFLGCIHPSAAVAQQKEKKFELPELPQVVVRTPADAEEEIGRLIAESERLAKERKRILADLAKFNAETKDGVPPDQVKFYTEWFARLATDIETHLAEVAAFRPILVRRDAGTRVGAARVIRGEVWQTDLLGNRKQLKAGDPILFKGAITTGPTGHLQVLLQDETVFTMGPDTHIVIDDFVYDPNPSVSKITAEITKGVFRWVTGKMRNKEALFRFGYGGGGIRATEFIAEATEGGAVTITMFSGAMDWTMRDGGEMVVIEAGSQLVIPAGGKTFELKKLDAQALEERRHALPNE